MEAAPFLFYEVRQQLRDNDSATIAGYRASDR